MPMTNRTGRKLCFNSLSKGIIFFLAFSFLIFIPLADLSVGKSSAKQSANLKVPPLNKKKLLKWLKGKTYRKKFTSEPEIHTSNSAHGKNVLTYYNPILVKDLKSGKSRFRKGATMVKELYFNSITKVTGYSVMSKVKKKRGKKGKGWLFYETFDGKNKGAFFGKGVKICANCHKNGTDFLLSEFRP